jgi:hypothetical protein
LGIYAALCVIAVVLFWDFYAFLALFLIVLASPFVAAAAVWCVPRLLNYLNDPRHVKRPPNLP